MRAHLACRLLGPQVAGEVGIVAAKILDEAACSRIDDPPKRKSGRWVRPLKEELGGLGNQVFVGAAL
jgi:hypothetical protein